MKPRILLLLSSLLINLLAFAQDTSVDMADTMRKEGKIYVVVAIILTIFAGIIFYLIRLDRKITKLEKEEKLNHFIKQ